MTKAAKQKHAQEKVLRHLMDPTLIDSRRIAELISQWAHAEFDINPESINRMLSPADHNVRTESIPEKNLFRIRIRLQDV
jgi:hypothetical protein